MTTLLKFMVDGLATEPKLHGINTTASDKSFMAKVRAIKSQQTKQTKKLINHKGGSDIYITLTEPYTPPNVTVANAKFIKIKELLTSLEEDSIRLSEGSTSPSVIANYRVTSAELSVALDALLYSLGLTKTPPKSPNVQNPV